MTDIAERLNEANWGRTDTLCKEAADEIERLRGDQDDRIKRIAVADLIIAERDAEIERLNGLLEVRDAFIVARDLWPPFLRELAERVVAEEWEEHGHHHD